MMQSGPVVTAAEIATYPTELLEQIRAAHIDYKRRQGHVIHVLACEQYRDVERPGVPHPDSIIAQIWHESTTWHHIYRDLCGALVSCSSDLERLDRLQDKLSTFAIPTMVHRPCSCLGRTPSPICPWVFVKSIYSRLYAAFLIDCMRRQDRDLIGHALALFITNLNLAGRARAMCSAEIVADDTESPAVASLLALTRDRAPVDFVPSVLSSEFAPGRLPDDIPELVYDIVVGGGHYQHISLLFFCVAMAPVDSPRVNRIIAQLTTDLGAGPGSDPQRQQRLAYWAAWSNWQIYIGRACVAAALSLDNLSTLFEMVQDTRTITDETPSDSTRQRLLMLLMLALVLHYRSCTGAIATEPAGAAFANGVLSLIRILKVAYEWDSLAYWLVHAMLYQLVHRLNKDVPSLKDCFSDRFALLTNVLALCTVVDDFVYFNPISYVDESQAELVSHQTYLKLRREIRRHQEFQSAELGTDFADSIGTNLHFRQISRSLATSDSPRIRPAIASLESVCSGVEEFDYKNVQRLMGLHIDPGTGQAKDLVLCQTMLQLLTQVRDEILPQLVTSPPSVSASNQLREEVRFFEHTCHFLDNIFIRNDKTALATILAKRLYDTGRTFKGFKPEDRKQWDQYVQSQIQGQLLKEQRRSATNRKPSALTAFGVMVNLNMGRNDWLELYLESETFPSHTYTIGDYRPELVFGTDSDQPRNAILNRRMRTVLSLAEQPDDTDGQMTIHKDRLHPQQDCVCRMLLFYKGREVIAMQNVNTIKAMYLASVSQLSSMGSGKGSDDEQNPGPNLTHHDQLWRTRRYHQRAYPYLCLVEFQDGACSEYLFKTSAERIAFAIMCSDIRNDILVYQPIEITVAPPRTTIPTQCEICSRSFSMFTKKNTCELCHAFVCKFCNERTNSLEFDMSHFKPIRLCRNCIESRSQINQRVWATRMRFERTAAAAFTVRTNDSLDFCLSSLAKYAISLQLSVRPVESPSKFGVKSSPARTAQNRLRSTVSLGNLNRSDSTGIQMNRRRSSKTRCNKDVVQLVLTRQSSLHNEKKKGHSGASPSKSPSFQTFDNSPFIDTPGPSLDTSDPSPTAPLKPLRFKTRRIVDRTASGKRHTQSAILTLTKPPLGDNDDV